MRNILCRTVLAQMKVDPADHFGFLFRWVEMIYSTFEAILHTQFLKSAQNDLYDYMVLTHNHIIY